MLLRARLNFLYTRGTILNSPEMQVSTLRDVLTQVALSVKIRKERMASQVLSADSHVLEPPDLWTTRMQAGSATGRHT